MKIKCICFLLVLLFNLKVKAQFFGTQFRDQFRYATILNYPKDSNHRVLANMAKAGSFPYCQIFVYNSSLQLADSIKLLNGIQIDKNNFVKKNNRLLCSAVYFDTLQAAPPKLAVLELDTLFNFVALHKLRSISNQAANLNLVNINGNFYAAFQVNFSSTFIYKLNNTFNLVDSAILNLACNDLQKFGSKILLSAQGNTINPCYSKYTNRLKALVLDTNLLQINCQSFDSIGNTSTSSYPYSQRISFIGPLPSKLLPISSTKILAAGSFGLNYTTSGGYLANAIAILNHSFAPQSVSVYTNSSKNVSYYDFSNFVSTDGPNILSVSCIGNTYSSLALAQPESTEMLIVKMDTLGFISKSLLLGGDMFYRPVSIESSVDGGIIIAGSRYDSTSMNNPNKLENFLYKVTKDTLELSTNNRLKKSNSIVVYPNPVRDFLSIKADFNAEITVTVFDLLGKKVIEAKNLLPAENLKTDVLASGYYILIIKANNSYTRIPFIKSEY